MLNILKGTYMYIILQYAEIWWNNKQIRKKKEEKHFTKFYVLTKTKILIH